MNLHEQMRVRLERAMAGLKREFEAAGEDIGEADFSFMVTLQHGKMGVVNTFILPAYEEERSAPPPEAWVAPEASSWVQRDDLPDEVAEDE